MRGSLSFFIFLSIVILIYSMMNYFFIRKHHYSTNFGLIGRIISRFIIVALVLTPFFMFFFIDKELYTLASCSSFIAYSWVAFLFLFISIDLTIDLLLFISARSFKKFSISPGKTFWLTFVFSILILIYGYFEAEDIRVEKVYLESNKLNSLSKPLRIVQISDTHFSPVKGVDWAKKIAKVITDSKPDILLLTGDFADKGLKNRSEIARVFKNINAKLGKFAVTGNHEYIAGIKKSCELIEKAGFQILHNEHIIIDDFLILVGTDDKSAVYFNSQKVDELAVLRKAASDKYTINLKHQPYIDSTSSQFFDLQLSGHTHAGQIFPFSFLVRLAFRHIKGLHEIDNETFLYINRGSGTWGPPFRFLAPPEITVFILKNTNPEKGKH